MFKQLAHLIANRGQTSVRPTTFRASKDGTNDKRLLVKKRYLVWVYLRSSPGDRSLKEWSLKPQGQKPGVQTGYPGQ